MAIENSKKTNKRYTKKTFRKSLILDDLYQILSASPPPGVSQEMIDLIRDYRDAQPKIYSDPYLHVKSSKR